MCCYCSRHDIDLTTLTINVNTVTATINHRLVCDVLQPALRLDMETQFDLPDPLYRGMKLAILV